MIQTICEPFSPRPSHIRRDSLPSRRYKAHLRSRAGIDLVGRIADRGAEFVAAREWMRICFELLEMLKAHKKAIRRAAVNTFGYIAKAIGPQDVLHTLLNNLKVQERQNRVCTTVAIGIVAETATEERSEQLTLYECLLPAAQDGSPLVRFEVLVGLRRAIALGCAYAEDVMP